MMNEQVPSTDPGVAADASRGRRRRRWGTALAVAAVALSVPGYFAFHVVKVKLGWPSETRNVWQYGQISANNWNHGFARGIAVRSADHEVVYWAENW